MTAITYVIAAKQIVLDPNTASVLTVNVKRPATRNQTCKFLKNIYIKYVPWVLFKAHILLTCFRRSYE